MLPRARFHIAFPIFIAFVVTIPALAQVEASAIGSTGSSLDESEMMTPPPVSGVPYANTASSDVRSNFLETNVTFSPAYIDNVLPGFGSVPVSEVTYSIVPSLALDHSAPRQQERLTYSPSFNFYEPTSSLNSVDQNASASYLYRFNPKVSFTLQDSFARISNVYGSSYVFSGTVTGSTLAPSPTVIAPFAEQIVNTVNGVLSYQFALNAMIGGGGSFNIFDLPNPANAQGLSNSHGGTGVLFYNRRLTRAQYVGLQYQYSRTLASPSNGVSETQTHSLLPFYTLYFSQASSLSLTAGIERVETTAPQSPAYNSWTPTGAASIGWQGDRGNVAASYSRTVSAGEGLLGAYYLNSASASGGWKFGSAWSGEVSAGYSGISSATPVSNSSVRSGNTLTAEASIQHSIGEHLTASFQYQHLRETYSNIAVISEDPDSNRESFTITYQLRKPLGR